MKKKFLDLLKMLCFFFISTNSFAQIKEEIEKIETSSKLVLIGETHNVNFNEQIQLALIEHLRNTNGLKYVILEHSYAGAFLYNKFLETGDTSLICQDFYFNSTLTKRNFWKNLYTINQAASEKIVLLGVDHDRSFPFVKTLNLILSDLKYQDKSLTIIKSQTDQFLSELLSPEKTDLEQYQKIKTAFNSFFQSHSTEDLKEIFGAYYSELFLIYHNQHRKGRDRNTNRKFYENLSRIIKEKELNTKEHSFLGIFGAAHCASNKRSFSNITFYSKSIFHKNVSTIMMHYGEVEKDGEAYYANTGLDFISRRLANNLAEISMQEANFKLLPSSSILSKTSKYDQHFKYTFYIKSSNFELENKFDCN